MAIQFKTESAVAAALPRRSVESTPDSLDIDLDALADKVTAKILPRLMARLGQLQYDLNSRISKSEAGVLGKIDELLEVETRPTANVNGVSAHTQD